MLEWQSESSLFTVRIRGKQWYWLYKFDLKTVTDVLTTPKNIGRNKWHIVTPGDVQVADDYTHLLQLRSQNKWVQKYWTKELLRDIHLDKFSNVQFEDLLAFNFYRNYKIMMNLEKLKNFNLFIEQGANKVTIENIEFNKNNFYTHYYSFFKNKKASNSVMSLNGFFYKSNFISDKEIFLSYFSKKKNKNIARINFFFFNNIDKESLFGNNTDFNDTARWYKRSSGVNSPLRIIKFPISTKNDFDTNGTIIELLRFRYDEYSDYTKQKTLPHANNLTMKQKRYKRRKFIYPRIRQYKDESGKNLDFVKCSSKPMLFDNKIVEVDKNPTKQYNMLKKKKDRNHLVSGVLSRRMLRTKRTLVLPAHVNITAITNSYDVIHSWFIAGLGLKMDCIPGRSTHHTFYIDNVGFYYGQCAEVCGRFHHHMPIRVCALPFEHFLIWWHSFGLPKLIFTNNKKNYQNYYSLRKFVW